MPKFEPPGETQLLNKIALACNLMCDRMRGGGGGGVTQQLGWDLKPILWGLKLEDYRTSILCENCARVRRCRERVRDIYCPHRSSTPERITKGWHKFTSFLSPSNKTVTMMLCTPISMKEPARYPILVWQKIKREKSTLTSSTSDTICISTVYLCVHQQKLHPSHFKNTMATTTQTKPVSGFQSFFSDNNWFIPHHSGHE